MAARNSMDVYFRIYQNIDKLIPGGVKEFSSKPGNHVKLQASGFMDLSIDCIGEGRISMAHNYIQNGDLMADPDMEIQIHPTGVAEALTFQQDSLGLYQEVYTEGPHGEKMVYPQLKKDLNRFLEQWLKNLKMQGFYR